MNVATLAGPYGVDFAGPHGVDLVGPYGVEFAAVDTKKFLGLYPWQWMFTGAAAMVTSTATYAATRTGKRRKKAVGNAAIAGVGGAVGGLLFALALGRYGG